MVSRGGVRRGEIWWADVPEAGRRPVLVLTRDSVIPLLARVIVVPATRRVRGLPSEMLLSEDDGMPSECALSFDNISLVPKQLLTERICTLRGNRLVEVCQTLGRATGC